RSSPRDLLQPRPRPSSSRAARRRDRRHGHRRALQSAPARGDRWRAARARRLRGRVEVTMRVLRIIARLNVGGPARDVVWLSEGVTKGRVETLLVTGTVPPGEDDMSDFAAAHGVTPHMIPSMSRELSPRD